MRIYDGWFPGMSQGPDIIGKKGYDFNFNNYFNEWTFVGVGMKNYRGFLQNKLFAISLFLSVIVSGYAADVTIDIDGASSIRTIPMTMYGGNLTAWDGAQSGSNSTFNNLLIASGRKYLRWCGGSWGDAYLWSDMEGPNGANTWIVSYDETLYLLSQLSQLGQEVPPTLQPIVNFPGCWYADAQGSYIEHGHQAAVDAAVAWVADQSSRIPTAQYWEIGNETGGPWEEGYFEGISGTYYGDYFADFYSAMKAENPSVKIGANAEPKHELQPWGWYEGYWTYDTLVAAYTKGVVPDFLIIHQYPGSYEPASYNSTLLSDRVDDIAQFTANMDGIVANALGSSYVGQIRYWMTEWDAGSYDEEGSDINDYHRVRCYVNALFHAQYILEMAKHNWEGSNAWAQAEYGSGFSVYPVWYIHPLLIHYFGRDMVEATSSNAPLVRAYAAKDTDSNLTVFIVNNSPTAEFTADINVSGFLAGTGGQCWVTEPAGSMVTGGVNIQDKNDISINGVVHPNPLTANALPSQSFASSNAFTVTLPASGMMLLKIPAGTGDATPPSAPTGLTASLDGINVDLNWNNNAEGDLDGYNIYRSTVSGSGYTKLNGSVVANSNYTDNTGVGGETYYYVARAVDTSSNESGDSNEESATIPETAMGTILRECWIGLSGSTVGDLTSNADFPDSPFTMDQLTELEGPTNWNNEYGTRIRGYLYPPTSGDYTFWIAGDDNCELWFSTDGTPANAGLIAEVTDWTNSRQWDKYSSQESASISLTAGQKYYIEVLHKEGTGGDNIAVAWSGPEISQAVIDGVYLSPWLTGLYGDFTGEGNVNMDDLEAFAALWLEDECVLASGMDLDGNCTVDLYEFSELAKNWLD